MKTPVLCTNHRAHHNFLVAKSSKRKKSTLSKKQRRKKKRALVSNWRSGPEHQELVRRA